MSVFTFSECLSFKFWVGIQSNLLQVYCGPLWLTPQSSLETQPKLWVGIHVGEGEVGSTCVCFHFQ